MKMTSLLKSRPSSPIHLRQLSFLLTAILTNLRRTVRRSFLMCKYLPYVLLLLNIRSFPFLWHFRLLRPLLIQKLTNLIHRCRLICTPKISRARAESVMVESICHVGGNPFTASTSYTSWAGVDDCDLNGHLSNSSYAKVQDFARVKMALAMFPYFSRCGGWYGLAGTHVNFIREIPALARYEIRSNVGAWDHKWIYVVSRFVTRKKAGTATKHLQKGTDGLTIHAISIARICFKLDRITVPPALILACHGYCSSVPEHQPYSHQNPPPHWKHARSLLPGMTEDPAKLKSFLAGGWRNVCEEERWWDDALFGFEDERVARLAVLNGLAMGSGEVQALGPC